MNFNSQSPKFSIITVTRNHREGLKATLESIRKQTCQDFELIVIDGHSTDGSDSVVTSFSDIITHIEKDTGKGIYAAMNQGAAYATGEWTIFMNAGDRFFDSTVLEKVIAKLDGDLAYGWVWRDGMAERVKHQPIEKLWQGNAFCHQALFTRTKWVKRYPFNTRYSISSDFNFYAKSLNIGCHFHQMELNIARIESMGVSDQQFYRRVLEAYKIARIHFPQHPIHSFYGKKLVRYFQDNLNKHLWGLIQKFFSKAKVLSP